MSRIGKIARRTFLIGSAAVVGGVAFGVYAYNRPIANPLKGNVPDGTAALTPFVKIDAEAITLITPRADSGQGAYSVQAMLIAEELDVELDQVKVDPGPPSAAYYNTALAAEAVPFRSTDDGAMANTMRGVFDAIMKFSGMQITGGSTTVPDMFERMRASGAVARETLKAAAAAESGVPVDQLNTAKGAVVLPDGTRLTYQSLAARAATMPPAKTTGLRDPGQWRLVGKPVQRHDIVAKSTGTQAYGIDFEMEGLVHASVRTNPRQGGALISYDDAALADMRGVKKVVPVTNGVAVVADNTWRAIQAVNAVEVEWGDAPYPAEQEDHWQVLSDSFSEDLLDSRSRDDGNVEAIDPSYDIVEAEYRAPYLAHAPLEPLSTTVLVGADRVDVWTGTQIPRFVQNNVAAITGMDADQVHIHVQAMGGSFGHRLEDDVVRHATEVAKTMPEQHHPQAGGQSCRPWPAHAHGLDPRPFL
jgi:isoquinoline 1-oxidoreductase beta subunit